MSLRGIGVCPVCGDDLIKVDGWGLWLCQRLGEDHIVQVYMIGDKTIAKGAEKK